MQEGNGNCRELFRQEQQTQQNIAGINEEIHQAELRIRQLTAKVRLPLPTHEFVSTPRANCSR